MATKYPPSIDYREFLLERLKDQEYAVDYLKTVIADSELDSPELQRRRILGVVKDIAEALKDTGLVCTRP